MKARYIWCLTLMVLLTVLHLFKVSPDGKQFSITSPDRRIRVFWFRTGKLRRVYDESLEVTVYQNFTLSLVALWT